MTILVQKTTTLLAKNNNFEFYIWYKINENQDFSATLPLFGHVCEAFGSCIRQATLAKLATRPGLHCFICDSVHSFFTQFSHLAMPFSTI
jgi:hypothetical protein